MGLEIMIKIRIKIKKGTRGMQPCAGPVTKSSAGVLAGEFIGRPARWGSGSWRRDAAKTRRRGRLRYFVNSLAATRQFA
jgi:hypothetical protein